MILRRVPALATISGTAARAVIVLASFFASGCEPAPPPPSQEAVTTAQQRSDQAAEAEQRVQHERRLRDIDRLRHDADFAELSGQVSLLRGLILVGLLMLLAALVWLVIEIRRRRVLTAMLHTTLEVKEGPDDSRK